MTSSGRKATMRRKGASVTLPPPVVYANALAQHNPSFEGADISAWTKDTRLTVVRSNAVAASHGSWFVRITVGSTPATPINPQYLSPAVAIPDIAQPASARIRARIESAAAGRRARADLVWFASDGSGAGAALGSFTTITGAWTDLLVVNKLPSDANVGGTPVVPATAKLRVTLEAPATGEVFDVDQFQINWNATTPAAFDTA